MGRMKDIFIEVMETYGTIPDDFNLDEYRLKKEMSDAEWQEHERKVEERKKRELSTNIYEDIYEILASLGMNIIVAIGFIIDYLDQK